MAIIVDAKNLTRVFEREQAAGSPRLSDSDFDTPRQIGHRSDDRLAGFAVAPSYILTGRDDTGRAVALIPIAGVCAIGQKDIEAGHSAEPLIDTCSNAMTMADELNDLALHTYYEKMRQGAYARVYSWAKEPAAKTDIAQNVSAPSFMRALPN